MASSFYLRFTITAAALLFMLVQMYLVVGGGVLLLGFGGSHFTASAAEGYFPFVIRVGVKLLFYYLVLAVGVQLANRGTGTTGGLQTSKYSGASHLQLLCAAEQNNDHRLLRQLQRQDMLNYAALAIVFAIVANGIPHMVADSSGARSASGSLMPSRPPTSHARSSIPSPALSRRDSGGAKLTKSEESSGRRRAGSDPDHTRAAPAPDSADQAQTLRPKCSIHSTDKLPATITVHPTALKSPRPAASAFTE